MNASIPDVLEMLGISVPSRIPGHILCTNHEENTPSLWVSEDRWWAFCCNVGGDGIDLVRFVTGASWTKAKLFLESGLGEEYVRPERQQRVLADLTDRFCAEAARSHVEFFDAASEFITGKWPHLGLDWLRSTFGVLPTRYALWIPHVDDEGVVRGIKTRSYATGNKLAVEGSCFTSRLYRGKLAGGRMAVLTEGESDTWTMTRHFESMQGIDVLGLPSGAKTWKQNFEDELASRYTRVDLWLDADRTGREAAIAVLSRLQGRGLATYDRVVPVDYGDVTEAYVDGWRPIP